MVCMVLLIAPFGLCGQTTEVIPRTIVLKEQGIHAKAIVVSNGEGILFDPIYQYGQQIYVVFSELDGLTSADEKYYPNLDVTLVSKKGDSIFSQQNLFGSDDLVPPILESSFNFMLAFDEKVAIGETYTLYCRVRDTRSDHVLQTEMDFKIINNPYIEVVKDGLDYSRVYLFSEDRQTVITDNTVVMGERVSLVFKDVAGFTPSEEGVKLELDYTITDSLGNNVIDNTGFFIKKGEADELKRGDVTMTFQLIGDEAYDFNASLVLTMKVSDKLSEVKLEGATRLFVAKE